MLVKNKFYAYSSLIIFGILTFIIWRAEVEYHGWEGLIWLSYFHFAIPISFLLFISWVNMFFSFENWQNRIIINSLLIFWIIVGYFTSLISLESTFITGPAAIMYLYLAKWKIILINFSRFIIVPLFPIITLFSLQLIKIKIPKKFILISFLIYIASAPISIFILNCVPILGKSDYIHIFKTGVIFPFLFISLGMPLIYSSYFQEKEIDILDHLNE